MGEGGISLPLSDNCSIGSKVAGLVYLAKIENEFAFRFSYFYMQENENKTYS
jgi:hypothetical protein